MKIQANKICVVCGREYTPRRYDQLTCCKECRTIYILEAKKARYRENYKYKSTAVCKICGKPVINVFKSPYRRASATMHDECVFEDCEKTLREGKTLSHVQHLRLQQRGFTIAEFKEEYMGLDAEDKIDWSKIETRMLCIE